MHSNEIIGYRVLCPVYEQFVDTDVATGHNFVTFNEPTPIPRGDAYRRLAAYLDQHPELDHEDFTVEPVYREFTPIETTSKELSARLKSLCSAHGLRLEMTDEQIEAKIAKELEELGASPIVDRINSYIGR